MASSKRLDRHGEHRVAFEHNRSIIFKTQVVCGICGNEVDFSLKYPDPLSPTVDHIIPISKGGHPSALENLQLAHRCCNRQKSDKLLIDINQSKAKLSAQAEINNDLLPLHYDWTSFKKNF